MSTETVDPASIAVSPCGEACVRVTARSGDRESDWRLVHSLGRWLSEQGSGAGITGLIPTYDALLIEFDVTVGSVRQVQELATRGAEVVRTSRTLSRAEAGRHFDVPVQYGGESGPDLEFVAELMGWSVEELIETHTAKTYVVRCYGSPAASPMLDAPLFPVPVPRLASPRAKVPAGVVSLAGRQATIAPASAPGGWQVIGQTPLTVLQLNQTPPVPYRPGDTLRFHRIDADTFERLAGQPLKASS